MRLTEFLCSMATASLCLWSCEKADPVKKTEPGIPYTLTKAQTEMVKGVNAFAFDLLEKVSEDSDFEGKDFMVSPHSISFVLGALNNGAAGQTSQEILSALGYEGRSTEEINEYNRYILQGCPSVDNLVKVQMANAVFVKEGYEFKDGFSSALTNYYDAYVKSLKFDSNALKEINDWCNEKTEGLIPQIIESIPDQACLFALNSIYFKGDWTNKFDKSDTKRATFMNIDGTSSSSWMMHMEDLFDYSSNDLWSIVRLPYGNGSYSMYILLPHEGESISDMIDALDFTTWENEKNNMRSRRVDLKIPSFETETDINLIDIMKGLGMERAFSPLDAEFGEMFRHTQGNIYLGLLKQKSRIIVNEEGTEASAVTIGGAFDTAMPPMAEPEVIRFHADRPFVYLIQERSSNAIFFIGAKVRS